MDKGYSDQEDQEVIKQKSKEKGKRKKESRNMVVKSLSTIKHQESSATKISHQKPAA
jgi:hypothetical protein